MGISGAPEGSPELWGMVGTAPAGILLPPMPSAHRRNLVEEVNGTYMKTCLYHKISHPLCPVFNLGYMAQESGQKFSALAEKVLCQAGGGLGPRVIRPTKAFQAQLIPLQPPRCGLS